MRRAPDSTRRRESQQAPRRVRESGPDRSRIRRCDHEPYRAGGRRERGTDAALAEIAGLMDARAATAQGDRLDVLVTLVGAYEEKHWRVNPPDPIEVIKLRMRQRDSPATIWRRFSGAGAECRRC